MAKSLVIVESPAKAKTIEKFLGKNYTVKSSIGHIRDMPKKNMGIDIKNNFQPTYEVSADKKKVVADLRKSVKAADKIYLATDDDREGEAIAWHLLETLNLPKDTARIVFHEITKSAITKAITSPRVVDYHLVDAQQARRIIDRLVGFEISPVLWRKISGARSAGRVQSPVMRLVVEREREIASHIFNSTFKVKAILTNNKAEIEVKLNQDFATKGEALIFAQALVDAKFSVLAIEKKPIKRSPKPPFITSTLQQEASQKLGFSVKQTMNLAQNLYRSGAITYMRTDSFMLSETAISAAKQIITQTYGADYHQFRSYKTKDANAQEAHEAIRPTDFTKPNIFGIDEQSAKLYELIYKRTLASQMSDAKLQKTQIKISISTRDEFFIATGEVLVFAGFLSVYDYLSSDDKLLPDLNEKDVLTLSDFSAKENFSRAKPRYTEASLVKKIEEMGIGRPSTFASMVSTVQERQYVSKETRDGVERAFWLIKIENGKAVESQNTERWGAEKNKLFPTNVAYLLNDFLIKHFNNIIDYQFTAKLESDFDTIATKDVPWQGVVKNFYQPFHQQIEAAADISREETHNTRELGTDPKSGKPVSVRLGRYGAFVQIGHKDSEEKPTFASLRSGQDIETITFSQALDLFNMPRTVGQTQDGQTIKANYGRFGPYLHYGKKYVSLKDHSPEDVTLETALELIAAKEKLDAERIIKTFDDSEIQILNGRFGPYIWNGKKKGKGQKNITIKKVFGDKLPADLSLAECQKAITAKPKPKAKKKKAIKKKSVK